MTGFDPGEGWRRLAADEILDAGAEVIHYSTGDGMRAWVRVPAVPPLPVEPYTVIRTGPMRWMKCGLYIHPDGGEGNRDAWMLLAHESQTELRAIQAADLQVQCIYDVKAVRVQAAEFGVEVLAEPRPVTAKAVLDRVRDLLPHSAANEPRVDEALSAIAREFGVES